MAYVSDMGGLPNWNQHKDLQGKHQGTWYRDGELNLGGLMTAPDAWKLSGDRDNYYTRWRIGDYKSQPMPTPSRWRSSQGFSYERANEAMGAPWGWATKRANAPNSISGWGQWYQTVDPTGRADYTTGRAARPYMGDENVYGRANVMAHDAPGRWAAREVIDWDAYDKKGSKWLEEVGKRKFGGIEDVREYHAWDDLGVAGRAAKKAEEKLAAEKKRKEAEDALRQEMMPDRLDVGQGIVTAPYFDPSNPPTIQLPDGRWISGHDYLNQARTMSDLQSQYGNLQSQYGNLQSTYGNLQNQFGGLQGQYAGLQGQLGGLQGKYDTAQQNWNQLSSQYQNQITGMQDAQAALAQRNRMANQFGWGGQGSGGIKHAMCMRQPGKRGWAPWSGFGREGSRITTGGINI